METQPSSSPAGSSPLTVSYNVDEAVDDDDSGDFGSTQETKDDEPDDLPPRYDDIVNNRTSGVTVCQHVLTRTRGPLHVEKYLDYCFVKGDYFLTQCNFPFSQVCPTLEIPRDVGLRIFYI